LVTSQEALLADSGWISHQSKTLKISVWHLFTHRQGKESNKLRIDEFLGALKSWTVSGKVEVEVSEHAVNGVEDVRFLMTGWYPDGKEYTNAVNEAMLSVNTFDKAKAEC
jgi:hypothetical protein